MVGKKDSARSCYLWYRREDAIYFFNAGIICPAAMPQANWAESERALLSPSATGVRVRGFVIFDDSLAEHILYRHNRTAQEISQFLKLPFPEGCLCAKNFQIPG